MSRVGSWAHKRDGVSELPCRILPTVRRTNSLSAVLSWDVPRQTSRATMHRMPIRPISNRCSKQCPCCKMRYLCLCSPNTQQRTNCDMPRWIHKGVQQRGLLCFQSQMFHVCLCRGEQSGCECRLCWRSNDMCERGLLHVQSFLQHARLSSK